MLRSREMKASLLAVLVMGLLNTSMFAAEDVIRNAPKFTPTVDGTVGASEIAGQLAISIAGFPIVAVPGPPNILVGTAYLSWDDDNINFSAIVEDNTPHYDQAGGNAGIFTEQDNVQAFFNPNNDHSGFDVWYDFSGDTLGGGGSDLFRRRSNGSLPFTTAEYNALINKTNGAFDGSSDANGYHVEAAIPWSVAMHDSETGNTYVPTPGDEHGIGFFVLSREVLPGQGFAGWEATCSCFTPPGLNTMVLLPEPGTLLLVGCGSLMLLFRRRR